MLSDINDKFKGWVTWSIISLICIVFVFTGLSYFFEGGNNSQDTIATVGNDKIYSYQLQQIAGTNKDNKHQALQQLIQRKLLDISAKNSGVVITDSAIQQQIFTMSDFKDNNGNYSVNKYNEIAQQIGGIDQLQRIIAGNLILQSFIEPMLDSQFVLPGEDSYIANVLHQGREVFFIGFNENHIKNNIVIPENKIKDYYNTAKSDFTMPESAEIEYVEINNSQFDLDKLITDDAIKQYYAEHKLDLEKDGKKLSLDESKDIIQNILKNRIAKEKISEIINKAKITNFESIIDDKNSNIKKENIIKDRIDSPLDALLADHIFQPNADIDYVKIDNAKGVLFKLLKKIPKHQLSYNNAKQKIRSLLLDKEINEIKSNLSAQINMSSNDITRNLPELKKNKNIIIETKKITMLDSDLSSIDIQQIFSAENHQLIKLYDSKLYVYAIINKVGLPLATNSLLPEPQVKSWIDNVSYSTYLAALQSQIPVVIYHE